MDRKKGCKIRKRGGSSSSSSSLARQNRFKRAIFAGKRAAQDNGGSGTPVKSISAAKTPVLLSLSPEKHSVDQFQKLPVSARKLAASLWEISDGGTDPALNSDRDNLRSKKPSGNRRKKSAEISSHHIQLNSSDPISRFGSERIILGEDIVRGRSTNPQKVQLIEYKTTGTNSVKTRFKNINDGLKTSKELVKVLKRIGKLGDDHKTASNRLISALVCELERARSSLKHLMSEYDKEEEENRRLIEKLREEAVIERKLRQRTEKMNRKLGRELAEAKETERKTKEEMEREKRARDVLEEVCDELARGIGEDKKDMEKEREMMRIADVLREERVQMKLMEAKFEFEEKHAAVERLKKELRRVLEGKGPSEIGQVLEIIDGSDDDDEESDLKSIELNMESGSKWGYVESRRDHRTESRFVGSGEDDDPVEKRSVVVDNGERDESLKTLKEYIVSNMRFIGSSSSEQWNHRHLPSVEFV
ncbi:hypothetical protein Bca4012_001112 [Brassica carinata]|uniref:Uncharacterized protein n=3 Tax=Brassica TaxID=3705 RepID=A0A0D3B2A3_BRAOL|nr:PREDICTED: cingulin-like [Brassica oleracea var. oleracea]XP_013682225.1 cingulin [Brassica napus]KAG2297392.1 hypothetical protein Bca52824_044061 [Brassica carinata]KAH0888625.1 hypothetical protein HID58_051054 [Brassica napus]CAF1698205.1 unnamed protein product [Brassica napus]